MAKNLATKTAHSSPMLLYNRTPQRATELAASLTPGTAKPVPSAAELPAAVSSADIIFTILSNDAVVESQLVSILSFGVPLTGKTFIECSTIAPKTANVLAELLTAAGAVYIAAPVFGVPAVAEAGNLVFVPAGPAAGIAALAPYTTGVMGRAVIPFPDVAPGTALQLKLIGNACILNMVSQLAESLALAEQTDVGAAGFEQFANLIFGGVHSAYARRMTQGTYWTMENPLFSADNAIKDGLHAVALGKSVGVELRNTETALAYLRVVKEHAGGEKGDVAGMYGAVRQSIGLKYENDGN